jgi:hypothetical protein
VDVVHFDTLAEEVMEPEAGEEPEGLTEVEPADVDSPTGEVSPAGEVAEPVTGDEPEGTAGEVAGKLPLGLAATDGAEVESDDVVSVTGQTVVRTAIVEVITLVESAGQLVTVEAQLVMVISLVV